MKTIPAAIAASLLTGGTRLAEFCKIERTDGEVLGFTTHDATHTIDGVEYKADNSLSRSAVSSGSAFKVDNMDIKGLVNSADITEQDIRNGVYNGARVTYLCGLWDNLAAGTVIIRKGYIGNIQLKSGVYEAEILGLVGVCNKALLKRVVSECQAEFGQASTGCGFNIASIELSGFVVAVVDESTYTLSTACGETYKEGRITFTSGLCDGLTLEIGGTSGSYTVRVFVPPPHAVAVDDTYTIVRGCNKSLSACEANDQVVNFRGFPYVPSEDEALSYET